MRFEWDPEKARQNVAKHGVSFEEAAAAFADPHHSDDEDRFLLLGATHVGTSSSWPTPIGTTASGSSVLEWLPDASGGLMPAAKKKTRG